jgi:alanine-glyoxylate transaminase/(R)-3-amino-2-methylpropionate-pyruvate transaminase
MELTRERGLLTGKNGVYGNVIRIQPPLCITKEDVNYVIQAFDDAFRQLK